MKRQTLALLLASIGVTSPALAAETFGSQLNSTMFYVSIPLDGKSPKEQVPSFGLTIRGSRDYQFVNIDSRFMSKFLEDAALGGIGAQWLIVGGVAAIAAVAVGGKDGSVATQQQQQQQTAAKQETVAQQQAAAAAKGEPAPCPAPPVCSPAFYGRYW
jgi:uncharacterized protein YdeI (BOF family)